jgi:hypothetical protein
MNNEKIESAPERMNNPISMVSASADAPNVGTDNSASGEPASKRMKLELPMQGARTSAMNPPATAPVPPAAAPATTTGTLAVAAQPHSASMVVSKGDLGESELVTCSDNSHTSWSNTSLQDNHPPTVLPVAASVPNSTVASASHVPPPPPRANTMMDLKMKYLEELEYMLREFRKLERQLLGAKGAAKLEESAGSRERREKLHSFILHLEETVQQIDEGCALEEEKDASGATSQKDEASKAEDDENVQRLEEHILTNLLPVKIRLKKQLAAQQGATKNPPGMPAPRRGSLQPTNLGKGTFAAAAEERRKQAEAAQLAAQEKEHAMRRVSDPSQFGKPLGGGGSSLTQKLHGATLGSIQRTHGHGVGTAASGSLTSDEAVPQTPRILYAGMVPQSTQHKSSLTAASGVHELVVQDPNFMESRPDIGAADSKLAPIHISMAVAPNVEVQPALVAAVTKGLPRLAPTLNSPPDAPVPSLAPESVENVEKHDEDMYLSDDERKRLRKKRRKRKLMRLADRREKERQLQVAVQQAQAAQGATKPLASRKKSAASKPPGKKGPKAVEYMCALCSETYSSTCDYNPWWALSQHECPKCRKMQASHVVVCLPCRATLVCLLISFPL